MSEFWQMTEREFWACYIHYLNKGVTQRVQERDTALNALINSKNKTFVPLAFEERIKRPNKSIVQTEAQREELFREFGTLKPF